MAGKNVLRGVCSVALMLGGCSEVEEGQPEVPATIQDLMAADFPADGEVHVRSQGVFTPEDAGAWCVFPPEISANLREHVPGLYAPGYGQLRNGTIGTPLPDRTVCVDDGRNLASEWNVTNNRGGTPYKLVLAVWQGDPADGGAIWIGGLERRRDLPDLPPPGDDMPSGEITVSQQEIEQAEFVAKVKWNLAKDANALSKQFSETIAVAGQ